MEGSIVGSHSHRLKNMYFVGRHFADPPADRDFVRDFPTDIESITDMYALTPIVTGQHGTYAFDELARLAELGRSDAIVKLIEVVSRADGAVGEFTADRLSVVARSRPSITLRVLSKMPTSTLDRVMANPLPWCDSAHKLEGVSSQNARVRRLQARIHLSRLHC
jgi:hypothetical protein